MLFAQFNLPDLQGLSAAAAFFEAIVIIVFVGGACAVFFAFTTGWNLTRNAKKDPTDPYETETSEHIRWPWWARLAISLGFLGFGFGLAAVAFYIMLEHNPKPDGWALGIASGALTATWLQSKRNAKRNLTWFTIGPLHVGPGTVSMFVAGAFYGLLLAIIIVHLYREVIETWHLVTACLLVLGGVAVKCFKKATPGSNRKTKWTLGSDLKAELGRSAIFVMAGLGFLVILHCSTLIDTPFRGLIVRASFPLLLTLLTGALLSASGTVWLLRRKNAKRNIPRNNATVSRFMAATSFAPALLWIIVSLMGPLFGPMGLYLYDARYDESRYDTSADEAAPFPDDEGEYDDDSAENKATSKNDLSAALRGNRLHFTVIGEIDFWADFHTDGSCYRGLGDVSLDRVGQVGPMVDDRL